MSLRPLLLSLTLTTFCLAAVAQAHPKGNRSIHYRQQVFGLIGWQFGHMHEMVRGKKPFDLKEFQKRAQRLAQLAPLTDEAFLPGSDQGAPTEAKAEIWKDPADFKLKTDEFLRAAQALHAATQGGERAAIEAQFSKTAETCKACHDRYKTD